MADSIDEEGRGCPDATPNTVAQVTVDLPGVTVLRHVTTEGLDLQTESGGVLVEMLIVKSTLMLEEMVMHLPESALARRGLGRFRRMLGMWVDLTQGKVPVDEAQLVTQFLLHSLDDTIGNAAVGAFVIGVLDQSHRASVRTLNVVSS